jgi:hypothetical protein
MPLADTAANIALVRSVFLPGTVDTPMRAGGET